MTEEEIIKIWNSIPPQGDPTGNKFAVKFAEDIEKKIVQDQEDELESAIRGLVELSERNYDAKE